MRVVLTGAASFTGLWFAQELSRHGHEVVAPLRGALDDAGDGLRRSRVSRLRSLGVRLVSHAPFGSDAFVAVLNEGLDALCHHGAEVRGYKDPGFDAVAALAANTARAQSTLARARQAGCRALVVTGSVFEPGEGRDDRASPAVSPYGLSKAMSWQTLRYWARALGLAVGKFVIANPFGPMESPRFGHYLASEWAQRRTPRVATPAYVRDNIHVDLLALAYRRFVLRCVDAKGELRAGPSGYVGSQAAFAERFARELGPRLGLRTPIVFAEQSDFPEPRVLANDEPVEAGAHEWSESAAWDALAQDLAHRLGI